MTVDGYMAGPNGEMDWMTWNWDEGLKSYVAALTAPVDCIVLGRNLAQGFIPHWAAVAANPESPDHAAGQKFTDTPKVVFTKTLAESAWPNTTLATGELADEIGKLKAQPGGDIIAYGGGTFVSALIRENLLDELHLFVDPAAIGEGMAVFKGLNRTQHLALVNATAFDCGIVVLCYRPKAG